MTTGDRVQKLEALLERVRRNRTAAPHHAVSASAEPIALEALSAPAFVSSPAPTPPMPPSAAAPAAPSSERPPPVAVPSWSPEPGSGMQARPGTLPPQSIPPEDLSDDDLLEVTTIPPDSVLEPDAREVSEVTSVSSDEQAPVSSSRFKVPETLGDAIDQAAELDGEHEVPVKTPPPESGPQEALPVGGFESVRTPDIGQLEADLSSPSMGPTAEQLGETIELEPPRGPDLEIDVTIEEPPLSLGQTPTEELEVALPRPSMQSGLYDVAPLPPAQAESPGDAPPFIPQEADEPFAPSAAPPAADGPERTGRPPLGATDAATVVLATPASPRTFVELLDASLRA